MGRLDAQADQEKVGPGLQVELEVGFRGQGVRLRV